LTNKYTTVFSGRVSIGVNPAPNSDGTYDEGVELVFQHQTVL